MIPPHGRKYFPGPPEKGSGFINYHFKPITFAAKLGNEYTKFRIWAGLKAKYRT